MNIDGALIFNYLKVHFGENVIYEPDGNVPPDFLIDTVFAVAPLPGTGSQRGDPDVGLTERDNIDI